MAIACQAILPRVTAIIALLAVIWGGLRYFEWKSLYYPTRTIEMTPTDAGLEFEDITFVAEDNCKLHGWWIPHEQARGTVIMFHGNAGNIGSRIWSAKDLHGLGLNCFLFDYRGYGKSSGIPSEKGLYRDARAAYEVVRAKYDDMDEPPIVLYGRSLGGAVAIQLATDKPVKGLIIESSFTSSIAIGEKLYPGLPVRWFCSSRYDSLEKIAGVTVPTIVAHSPYDDLIPFDMGKELYAASGATDKTFSELQGDHNTSGWTSGGSYWLTIANFVNKVLVTE